MDPEKRRKWMIEQLEDQGKVEVDSLAEELNVSAMTIRRDLDLLETEGLLIRTHGGAVLPQPISKEASFQEKETRRIEQKKMIAKKAISLVKDRQTILLDSGTTTLEIAKLLKNRDDITVVTNDIKIAAELFNTKLKVFITGGELQNDVGTLFGPQTNHFLQNIHVDICFLGAHALDLKAGVTSSSFEKSQVKQLMTQCANETWLVADSSKINQKTFAKVCDLHELTGFITDDDLPSSKKDALAEILKVF